MESNKSMGSGLVKKIAGAQLGGAVVGIGQMSDIRNQQTQNTHEQKELIKQLLGMKL